MNKQKAQKIFEEFIVFKNQIEKQKKFVKSKSGYKQLIKKMNQLKFDDEGSFINQIQELLIQINQLSFKDQNEQISDSESFSDEQICKKVLVQKNSQYKGVTEPMPQIGFGKLSSNDIQRIIDDNQEGLSFDQLKNFDQEGFIVLEDILNRSEIMQGIGETMDVFQLSPLRGQYLGNPTLLNYQTKLDPQEQINIQNSVQKDMLNEPRNYFMQAHYKLRNSPYLKNIYKQLYNQSQQNYNNRSLQINQQNRAYNQKQICYYQDQVQVVDTGQLTNIEQKVQGKQQLQVTIIVNITERKFKCIPGSNQPNWQEQYQQQYLKNGGTNQFQQNNTNKLNFNSYQHGSQEVEDPWELSKVLPYEKDSEGKYITPAKTQYNCIRDVHCPAGSILIFNSNLMYSVNVNEVDKINYGFYFSFQHNESHQLVDVNNKPVKHNWIDYNEGLSDQDSVDIDSSISRTFNIFQNIPVQISDDTIQQMIRQICNKQLQIQKYNNRLYYQQYYQQQYCIEDQQTNSTSNFSEQDLDQDEKLDEEDKFNLICEREQQVQFQKAKKEIFGNYSQDNSKQISRQPKNNRKRKLYEVYNEGKN